jgi:hypothetical protein
MQKKRVVWQECRRTPNERTSSRGSSIRAPFAAYYCVLSARLGHHRGGRGAVWCGLGGLGLLLVLIWFHLVGWVGFECGVCFDEDGDGGGDGMLKIEIGTA